MSCPICGKPTAPAWRPFCSRRCADIDLGNWIDGSYRVPAEEAADVPDDPGPAETEPGAPH
ncbi:MAG: DNA gyrase inhibitor YacG [Sedimentitalea sp.]|nr:DNA gyrase inhibitor YacG [Sedimentitalea sp.]